VPQTSDFVLQRLREWGVHRVFAYPGDGINRLYDAKLDHQPVVAIVGQQKRIALGALYQQEIDLDHRAAWRSSRTSCAGRGRTTTRPGWRARPATMASSSPSS